MEKISKLVQKITEKRQNIMARKIIFVEKNAW